MYQFLRRGEEKRGEEIFFSSMSLSRKKKKGKSLHWIGKKRGGKEEGQCSIPSMLYLYVGGEKGKEKRREGEKCMVPRSQEGKVLPSSMYLSLATERGKEEGEGREKKMPHAKGDILRKGERKTCPMLFLTNAGGEGGGGKADAS